MMTRRFGIVLAVVVCTSLWFAEPARANLLDLGNAVHEALPGFRELPLTQAGITEFVKRVERDRAELILSLTREEPDKKMKKILEKPGVEALERIIAGANAILEQLPQEHRRQELVVEFRQLQRIHYSVLADLGKGKERPGFLSAALTSIFRTATHVAIGPLLVSVPAEANPGEVIGEEGARLEAQRLRRADSRAEIEASQISRMSPVEISRLEPRVDHPAYDGGEVGGGRYAAFLERLTRAIRASDKKLSAFDFGYARRILFFDSVKESASSPKITTRDRYGLKWKMKWGDEVHTDTIATRLYIELGGAYVDQKFHCGPGETILVLDPPNAGSDGVTSFSQLAAEVKRQFRCDLTPFLLPGPLTSGERGEYLGMGQVDSAMIERDSIDPKYLGAWYLKFKECQVSLYNPIIDRLGGVALNRLGAMEDRVARASLVFNSWIHNVDMKDDNSRGGFLLTTPGGKETRYVEFQSDLGATFGTNSRFGELNSFCGKMVFPTVGRIHFLVHPMFVPKAWNACTWADARWMALRIARLSREDLERLASESGWPSFCQRLVVEKLISRRNGLVKAFALDLDEITELPCKPEISISAEGDEIVVDGRINPRSPTVRKHEETLHPEGLSRIRGRLGG